jgi:hypothetical protein
MGPGLRREDEGIFVDHNLTPILSQALRMRTLINNMNDFPHAEERPWVRPEAAVAGDAARGELQPQCRGSPLPNPPRSREPCVSLTVGNDTQTADRYERRYVIFQAVGATLKEALTERMTSPETFPCFSKAVTDSRFLLGDSPLVTSCTSCATGLGSSKPS